MHLVSIVRDNLWFAPIRIKTILHINFIFLINTEDEYSEIKQYTELTS